MTRNAIDSALAVMERHISALNAGDEQQLAATLHFPHFRLSGVSLTTWHTQAHYFRDFLARAGSQWCYSRFKDIQVLQASSEKVHLDVEVRRFAADDALISRFRSLWVIVQIDGVWAAKFRSSFATQ
jgi:hypothetical protein